MSFYKKIRDKIIRKILFNKVKKLDSKYFATLCDNWKEIQNLDNIYCFPYDRNIPKFGHSSGEVPISIGLEAMLKGYLKNNSIILRNFQKEDELLIRKYIFFVTGNDKAVYVSRKN